MAHERPVNSENGGTVCFPLPEDVIPANNFERRDGSVESGPLFNDLSSANLEGLSRIVATMMCGEESAAHVFQREGKRLDAEKAASASTSLMFKIATEEAEHESLLGLMRSELPVAFDEDVLRSRARFFFIRVASRDPAIHFSRIVGLDSGVCITLNSMLQPSAALDRAPAAYRIWKHIWKDEAAHVRTSRKHVLDLGLPQKQMQEESLNVRKAYADRIVKPLGEAFEQIGVDTDSLCGRIVRSDIV